MFFKLFFKSNSNIEEGEEVVKAKSLLGKSGIVLKVNTEQFKTEGLGNYQFAESYILVLSTMAYKVNDKKSAVYIRYWAPKLNVVRDAYINDDMDISRAGKVNTEKVMKTYREKMIESPHTFLVHGFSSGTDPEVFIEDKEGVVVPAFNFLPSKAKSNNLPYWDGFQAEFTVFAGGCLDGVMNSIRNQLSNLQQAMKRHNKDAKLSAKSVMNIPIEMRESAKDEHVQFGCAPSLNIYGMKGISANGKEVPFRPAGGHLHFGVGKLTKKEESDIVKALDAIVGVACVSLFAKYDDARRRTMYGLAGEYRLPAHGIEYRTLSNAWLFHPLMFYMVFDLARKAIVLGRQGLLPVFWQGSEEETIKVINEHNVEGAREIMKRNKETLLMLFTAAYRGNKDWAATAYEIFFKGMESVIDKPEDIASNWGISTEVGAKNNPDFYRFSDNPSMLKKKVSKAG